MSATDRVAEALARYTGAALAAARVDYRDLVALLARGGTSQATPGEVAALLRQLGIDAPTLAADVAAARAFQAVRVEADALHQRQAELAEAEQAAADLRAELAEPLRELARLEAEVADAEAALERSHSAVAECRRTAGARELRRFEREPGSYDALRRMIESAGPRV